MQAETQDLDQLPVAEQSSAIEQVPIIDVEYLFQDSASSAAREAIDQIAEACRTWGFFQVINHGISNARIEQVWRQDSCAVCAAARGKARYRPQPGKSVGLLQQ
jgi:flavin-binding protein dodecin